MSEKSPGAPVEDKKHRRRPWLILGGIALLLVAVLGWLLFFHDGPPPDDAHLMPKWSARGGNANPLAAFCISLKASKVEDWRRLSEEARNLDANAKTEMQAFVDAHAGDMAAFESLMHTNPANWQWPDAPKMTTYLHADINPVGLHELGLTLRMKARLLSLQGKTDEAVELCLQMLRAAEGMRRAEGMFHHLLISSNIQSLALTELQKCLRAPDANAIMIRKCLKQLLSETGVSREDVHFAMRVDYAWFKDCIAKEPARARLGSGFYEHQIEALAEWYFKPNLTLAQRVSFDEPILLALSVNWGEVATVHQRQQEALADAEKSRDSYRIFLDSNHAGKSVAYYSFPTTLMVLNSLMKTATQHQLTTLLLALRLHELDRGHLPSALDALAPEYIPAVPEDMFTGKPMRWNGTSKLLYSAGENRKDDGGDIHEEIPGRGKDFGLRYSWDSPLPVVNP